MGVVGVVSAPTLTLPRKPIGSPAASLVVPRDIEHRDRLAEAFQGKVADLFEPGIAFDRAGDPLRHEDLAVDCGVAQPRGEVAGRTDRRVVDAVGKTDLAKGRV